MTRGTGEPGAAGRTADAHEPPPFPEKLEETLLNGPRRYTRAGVAHASGVPEARATQIWRTLGFPLTGEDEVAFTDGDVHALLTGERFVETGLISADSETMMTRQLGHHLSRLAEWQVAVIWSWLRAQPELSELDAEGADFLHLLEQLLPDLEQLQNHVWRRHPGRPPRSP